MKLGALFPAGTSAWVSQRWGADPTRYNYESFRGHNGMDIACARGTPILASGTGVVTRVESEPNNYGEWLEVQYDGFALRHAHGVRGSIAVKLSDDVAAGDVLMHVNDSGSSRGHHTHVDMRTRDRVLAGATGRWYESPHGRYVIDPSPWLPKPFGQGRALVTTKTQTAVLAALERRIRWERERKDAWNAFAQSALERLSSKRWHVDHAVDRADRPAAVVAMLEMLDTLDGELAAMYEEGAHGPNDG